MIKVGKLCVRIINLPLDIQLFHNRVVPVSLYGCELYGFENI